MRKLHTSLIICLTILISGCVNVGSGRADNSHGDFADDSRRADLGSFNETRLNLLEFAESYIGTPYNSPPNVPSSFDCSGFVSFVYSKFGYFLPHSTAGYAGVDERIEWEDAEPGDILVFGRARGSSQLDHVAILYKKSGNGQLAGSEIIHAASINTGTSMLKGNPNTKTGVVITELGLRGDGIIENEYFYQRYIYCIRVFKNSQP
ncbi:MAG: NlpC/P60 family protein [Treponema sp.]|nr:NlpC/P60 family protein [Treponema sp.]